MAKRFAKPIDQDIEDELEEDEMEEEFEDDDDYEDYEERSRLLPFAMLTIALLAFVGLGWYAYQAGSSSNSEDLMLVEAEQTPIKEKPLDAGGMQFPHQDKSVFETIAGGDSTSVNQAQVINNVEEPITSAPIESAESTTTTQAATPVESTITEQPIAESVTAAPAAPVTETIKEAPVASVKEVVPETKPVQTVAPKQAPKAVPVAASGNQTVQLGAFKTQADAEAAWKKVSGQSVLAGTSPDIIRADLGDKGIFYRLRVGGVDAKATCASLAGKSPCMLVK